MGRRAKTFLAPNRLAAALVAARGGRDIRVVAPDLGISYGALARLERGGGVPAPGTAAAIAHWLGWTMEQVYAAAAELTSENPTE